MLEQKATVTQEVASMEENNQLLVKALIILLSNVIPSGTKDKREDL